MTERVGFAGTGLMGRGMAKNILAAGHPLAVVAHRSRAPIEELVQRGATELPSYRQLAAGPIPRRISMPWVGDGYSAGTVRRSRRNRCRLSVSRYAAPMTAANAPRPVPPAIRNMIRI